MIYSATRRRSAVETLAGVIGQAVLLVVAFWFITSTGVLRNDAGIFVFAIWLAASLIFCTITHEMGHLVVGLLLGRPVRKFLIGTGSTLFSARPGGIRVQVCSNLLGGGVVYFSGLDDSSVEAKVASTAAGPAVNILTGVVALAALPTGWPWLGTLAMAALLLGFGNAIPSRFTSSGREHFTDGMQIVRAVRGRAAGGTYFEGEDLTPDGERVTIRAIEEAVDSESEQTTERHLLAALNGEPAIRRLLAPARIDDLIRFGAPHDSQYVRPMRSPAIKEIYKVVFRIARDLGLPRPNAACLALALMAVESDVATRLKGSVDEAALRELATRQLEAKPAEDPPRVLADLELERWGSAAEAVLAHAFRVAVYDRADETGTQHLITAIVATPNSRAALALGRIGFQLHRNEKAVPAAEPNTRAPALTPEAQSAIAAALIHTGPTYPCGTGELLLGILDQRRSMSAALFASCDFTPEAVLAAIVALPREQSVQVGFTQTMRQMWDVRARSRFGAERYLDSRQDYLALESSAPTEKVRAIHQNNVAEVSLLSGDRSLFADALERSRAAAAVLQDMPSIQSTYAFALLESGDTTQAAEILERVIPVQPRPRDRALELCLLAMCRARLGNLEAAKSHVAAAEQIDARCSLLGRARAEVAGSPILT